MGRFLPLQDFAFDCKVAVIAAIFLLIVSGYARRVVVRFCRSDAAFPVLAAATAWLLSLGPTMHTRGAVFGTGPYAWLYDVVPGFDGLRVPARFAWVLHLFLVVLAGLGAARLLRLLSGRLGSCAITTVLILLVLFESFAVPLPMNLPSWNKTFRRIPSTLETGPGPQGIYRAVAMLPKDAVLAELPFGEQACDLRYMFSSTFHWRRLLNGFSGARPPHYPRLSADLSSSLRDPPRAWRALERSAATHVVVHKGFWGIPRKGRRLTQWLVENGSTIVARDGSDVLLALPRHRPVLAANDRMDAIRAVRVWQNVAEMRLERPWDAMSSPALWSGMP
jgi:hypothetical protein